MQTVNLICVGKLKEDYLRAAQTEYEKRLSAFCRLNRIEVAEYRLPPAPSPAQIEKGLSAEGKCILEKCRGTLVALCIEGKEMSSPQLASFLEKCAITGESELSFIIGGSYGLSSEVKEKAGFHLSMSPMTFPHQLARIMLLEQLYRSYSINGNGKYHK